MTRTREVIIKSTHRGLRYEDGRLTEVLEAGRYEVPAAERRRRKAPVVEIVLVDMRERELLLKGQEILTSDKVAVRVSIITQYRVVDPTAALEKVEAYTDRLYSDVQLAARRSLASMTLEGILTNRNRLSEDILGDVQEAASGYGIAILRADVKDLVFPGNLQEIMNRVLATERLSEAQLVEARTKAEREAIEARSRAENERISVQSRRESELVTAEGRAQTQRMQAEAEAEALRLHAEAASAYADHPVLLRVRELETLARLATNAEARLYIGFDKHTELRNLE
ncbi:SPFH domain-containing protein [Actinomadura sp. DC4]|uniref:SPFH domain-containing protein n=1 Tax=Actinomadura sp. DC4 TaxID=3055069 RepID=UPI0025AFE7AE|nr:SPFH domain-containing protein [Actinomadura sp. DC4]MDN3351966.1 SPFH domain-containing protein [Actinomadura sp. DC4]